MTFDFRATQVRTVKIISSGSLGPASLLIYHIDADGTPTNQGNINTDIFPTGSIGTDIFMYVSGGKGYNISGSGITAFGGDLYGSGSLSIPLGVITSSQLAYTGTYGIEPYFISTDRLEVLTSQGNTINARTHRPYDYILDSVQVYMFTSASSSDVFDLYIHKGGTPPAGTSLLNAASFDLTTIASDTVTNLTLATSLTTRTVLSNSQITLQASSAGGATIEGGEGFYIMMNYIRSSSITI